VIDMTAFTVHEPASPLFEDEDAEVAPPPPQPPVEPEAPAPPPVEEDAPVPPPPLPGD
jgi:hypothetical protein